MGLRDEGLWEHWWWKLIFVVGLILKYYIPDLNTLKLKLKNKEQVWDICSDPPKWYSCSEKLQVSSLNQYFFYFTDWSSWYSVILTCLLNLKCIFSFNKNLVSAFTLFPNSVKFWTNRLSSDASAFIVQNSSSTLIFWNPQLLCYCSI